jgi:antirestriction protein ArdC
MGANDDKGKRRPKGAFDGPRHEMARLLIEQLKENNAPWQKPWTDKCAPPFNPVSGTCYRGVNRLLLLQRGHSEPRWLSFKQAQKMGWRIKAGARAQSIEYWSWGEKVVIRDDDGSPLRDGKGAVFTSDVALSRPRVRLYHVFNMSQVTDAQGHELPPWDNPSVPWEPSAMVERLLGNSGAKLSHDQRDRAFYDERSDSIHVPPKSSFDTTEGYYSTVLHELAHWTKHPSRLNRDLVERFGSQGYAMEELRAEIASWMLAMDLGLNYSLPKHASYVKHWIGNLEEDHHEIFVATAQAEKIRTFVLKLIPDFKPAYGKVQVQREGVPPAETTHLPTDSFLEFHSPVTHDPRADFQAERKPRAALVNSFFGLLLRPGLMLLQERRWLSILSALKFCEGKKWARCHKLQVFLAETKRLAKLSIQRLNEDRRLGADEITREVHAYNNCLALLNFARETAVPDLMLSPNDRNPPGPKYLPVAVRRRKGDEESFPFSISGFEIANYRLAGDGEKVSRNFVVNLENMEILGVFRDRGNSEAFARALESESPLYLGDTALEAKERELLTQGQYQDPKFPKQAPPMTDEEIQAVHERIGRMREHEAPSMLFTEAQERLFRMLRETGEWRKAYRPVTFDSLPEEMRLGCFSESKGTFFRPFQSDIYPDHLDPGKIREHVLIPFTGNDFLPSELREDMAPPLEEHLRKGGPVTKPAESQDARTQDPSQGEPANAALTEGQGEAQAGSKAEPQGEPQEKPANKTQPKAKAKAKAEPGPKAPPKARGKAKEKPIGPELFSDGNSAGHSEAPKP